MTDEHTHAADAHHVGGGHDHDHDEGHADAAEEHEDQASPLGPIDWRAWGISAIGLAVGVAIAVVLALPTLRA